MTIAEIQNEFKIGLDKTDSLNYPDFEPEEIDVFLNKTIEKFISNRMYGGNVKKESIEETQKRFDDLLTLVTGSEITTFLSSQTGKPNSVIAELPSNYLHTIDEEVTITYSDCNNASKTKRIPVYATTHDKYNKVIRDPFNKPDKNGVLRLGLDGDIELIPDPTSTITIYHLRYIRKPAVVKYGSVYPIPTADVECDLPSHTHKEIIALAVQDALQNIESRRYPAQVQENITVE